MKNILFAYKTLLSLQSDNIRIFRRGENLGIQSYGKSFNVEAVKSVKTELLTFLRNEEIKSASSRPAHLESAMEFQPSSQQRHLLNIRNTGADDSAYNIPVLLRVQPEHVELVLARLVKLIAATGLSRFQFTQGNPAALGRGKSQPLIVQRYETTREQLPLLLDEINYTVFGMEEPLCRVGEIKVRDDETYVYFVVHHIIADGWTIGSVSTLLDLSDSEFDQALEMMSDEGSQKVIEQHNRRENHLLETQSEFWEEYLRGSAPLSSLSIANSGRSSKPRASGMTSIRLTESQVEKVLQTSSRLAVTSSSVILSVFVAALYDLSRSADIALTITNANRDKFELEKAPGYLTKTNIFRHAFDRDQSFDELVVSVNTNWSMVNQFSDLDLVENYADLGIDPESLKIFDIMYTHQNFPHQYKGHLFESIDLGSRRSKTAVEVEVYEQKEGIEIRLLFDESRVSREWQNQFHNSVVQHVQSLIDDTKKAEPLGEIIHYDRFDCLTAPAWKNKYTLISTIEQRCRSHRDFVAIVDNGIPCRYKDLYRRVKGYQSKLEAEKTYIVLMTKGVPLVATLLAIMTQKSVFICIDPSDSPALIYEKIHILPEAVIITSRLLEHSLPLEGRQVLCVDDLPDDDDGDWTLQVSPSDIAYGVYC